MSFPQVKTFSDNKYKLNNGHVVIPELQVLHDPYATNHMNLVCDQKSAWQILREHKVFSTKGKISGIEVDEHE